MGVYCMYLNPCTGVVLDCGVRTLRRLLVVLDATWSDHTTHPPPRYHTGWFGRLVLIPSDGNARKSIAHPQPVNSLSQHTAGT